MYRALKKQGVHYKQVQKAIDTLDFVFPVLTPRACVIGIDTTYFSRDLGVVIFKDITNNAVLHWMFVRHENLSTAIHGIEYLQRKGITPLGYVVDGTWGFFARYGSCGKVQMCLKHMKNIIKKYITTRPKLPASKELKEITDKLCHMSKNDFDLEYDTWLTTYSDFLKERTYDDNGSWVYTHQRLRSAVNSINRYRPYLFTYQQHRWLKATNNSVEGSNAGLKGFLGIHNGLRPDRKLKLIHYYLLHKSSLQWGRQ